MLISRNSRAGGTKTRMITTKAAVMIRPVMPFRGSPSMRGAGLADS
jgi:hypothetical protein